MFKQSILFMRTLLLTGFLASGMSFPPSYARLPKGRKNPEQHCPFVSSPPASPSTATPISRDLRSRNAAMMYKRLWGVKTSRFEKPPPVP